jgi:hypothetical protein
MRQLYAYHRWNNRRTAPGARGWWLSGSGFRVLSIAAELS